MYILNISSVAKKMTVNEIRDFIFEFLFISYYSMENQRKKELQLSAIKLTEKIPDPRNSKEHYQSFIRKKTKSV